MRYLAVIAALWLWAGPALAQSAPPPFWENEWPKTDFSRTSVESWGEILSGGPPRDGIPAIDGPRFIAADTETRIPDREPVVTLRFEGAPARAYPLRYLVWHEIVNDEVAGIPVAVTYCPLCNSVPVFSRALGGRVLSFGVTGKLRGSNLIMYDRETESWWQQATGEGIVGTFTGAELDPLPSWQQGFGQFREENPDGLVMDEPDWPRAYGMNPYASYDSSRRPFLYGGEPPPHGIAALARVVRVGERAWTLERLRAEGEVREAGLTLSWTAGQASALDTRQMAAGREVGTVRVRDASGRDVAHDIMFAFAFNEFYPEGEWMLPK